MASPQQQNASVPKSGQHAVNSLKQHGKPELIEPKQVGPSDGLSFGSLKAFLIGREVTIYAPPKSAFQAVYDPSQREGDPASFTCTVLDITIDPVTGAPLTCLGRHRPKNARKFQNYEVINLAGCSISIPTEIVQDQEEEQAETSTVN